MARQRDRPCHIPTVIPVFGHDWHVLKRLRTAGARVARTIGVHVLLKFAAITALAALAVYILTSAAGGRGLAWGDIPTWVTGAGTVGALFVAFYQIGQERKRRIAQEAEFTSTGVVYGVADAVVTDLPLAGVSA
jgi:hypothetical protein